MVDPTRVKAAGSSVRLRWMKVGVWLGLIGLLGLGFMGYLMPGMSLSWDALMTMCGF